MNEKEITIKVPEGKRTEWINGVLTLVDEPKKDDRPVTERIKTFEDACNELGDKHPFVKQYRVIAAAYKSDPMTEDLIAYLKLRIIIAALNEGWEPKFTEEEFRYYPWFCLYTREQYDNLEDDEKQRCALYSINDTNAYCCIMNTDAVCNASFINGYGGSRLSFRTRELAEYAGIQFIQEWADFVFKPRSCEGLNEK